MPAGRVLIRSLRIGKDILGPIQYQQMCGRGGRAGLTEYGESFLVVNEADKKKAFQLLAAALPAVNSQMGVIKDGGKALMRAILGEIVDNSFLEV